MLIYHHKTKKPKEDEEDEEDGDGDGERKEKEKEKKKTPRGKVGTACYHVRSNASDLVFRIRRRMMAHRMPPAAR